MVSNLLDPKTSTGVWSFSPLCMLRSILNLGSIHGGMLKSHLLSTLVISILYFLPNSKSLLPKGLLFEKINLSWSVKNGRVGCLMSAVIFTP